MKTRTILFLLAVLFQGCNQSGQKKDADDSLQYYPPTPVILEKKEFRRYYRELSEFFDTTLLNKGFNGSILIAKNGAIIYEKYQGFADLRKKVLPAGNADTLTDSTSLHIASTSKTLTSIAVLGMVQENRISLNDTITRFFSALPYPGITIKLLLNHRSGLPNYLYFMSGDDRDNLPASPSQKLQRSKAGKAEKKYVTNQDVLNFLITQKPGKIFPPGSRFNYCNTNYLLLALLVEKISGKSFPEYMKEKFFDPIQMKHTYVFTLKDTLTATPSFTYNGSYWNYDFLDGTYGDKNIYTTPRDLLKWDQALYTDQLISKSLLDSAFTGYSFEKPSVHNYGLGWRLQLLPNGKKIVYHFGKWHGSNAAFARLIDEKVTIIILGNRFTRNIYNAAHLCYDIFGEYLQRHINAEEEGDSVAAEKKMARPELKNKRKTPAAKPFSGAKH